MKRVNTQPRYGVMSAPGRRDDGSDTYWFVVDERTRKSEQIGAGDKAQIAALRKANELNKALAHGAKS